MAQNSNKSQITTYKLQVEQNITNTNNDSKRA
jgi:hypothetical protein